MFNINTNNPYDAFLGVTENPPPFLAEEKFLLFIAPGALFTMPDGPVALEIMPDAGVAFLVFFLVDFAFPIYFIFH
ncbi:MAG: hypothetical protein C0446_09835 [Chitinophaga sp.]|nr:hypothetical protein [Chitinophaga sp.]PJE46569.1 MAG: hypothetical protein CUR34_08030 [Sediminibacterium sp.] [Sediminibacterium sp. FEMGT703S]